MTSVTMPLTFILFTKNKYIDRSPKKYLFGLMEGDSNNYVLDNCKWRFTYFIYRKKIQITYKDDCSVAMFSLLLYIPSV